MKVNASSFADPADIRAFRQCKAKGGSDQQCFKKGDNGVGYWGDDCSAGAGPCCALPPDDIIAKWGSVKSARKKKVRVKASGREIVCELRDRMPWKRNITNGAGIDLNPDAVGALGLKPPVMVAAEWDWA